MVTRRAGSVAGTIRLPSPHAGQRIVFGGAKRFNWASMGRRWRKTSGVMTQVVIPAVLDGKRIMWASPSHDQNRIAWDEASKALGNSGVARFNKTEQTIYFDATGGRIVFRSMDEPNSARGHTADGIVVDEAADVPEAAWYEVLRPMLLDTRGWAWVIGTPKGRNWFWREWVAARDRDDSTVWQAPACGVRIDPETQRLVREPHPLENPDIDFAEMEGIWERTPERSFRQEYLAEFIEDGGGVFRGVDDIITASLREPYMGHFAMGIDFARVADFTVLTLIDIAKKAVVDWQRFNQVDWHNQQLRIRAMYHRWTAESGNNVQILAEKNMAGDPVIEALRRSKLPIIGVTTTSKNKTPMIQELALAIERKQLSIPPVQQLIDELKAYEQERLPSGVIRYGAPSGMFDDCVMSLALAWKLARSGARQRPAQDFRFVVNNGAGSGGNSLIAAYRRSLSEARKVVNG